MPMVPPGGINGYVILASNDTVMGRITSKKINGMQFITQVGFRDKNDTKTDYPAEEIMGFGFRAWEDKKNNRFKTYLTDGEAQKNNYPGKWVNYESRAVGKKGKKAFVYRVYTGSFKVYQDPMSGYGYSRTNSSLTLQDKNAATPPPQYQKFIAQPPNTKLWNLDDPEFVYFLDKYSYKVILNGPGWSFGSYYFDLGDGQLIKIKNKNYQEYWPQLFGSCEAVEAIIEKDDDRKKFAYFKDMLEVYKTNCD